MLKKALDITYEMSKLIKYSPKRDVMFSKLKDELQPECPGIRVLCPTRWTVRADSLKSVLDNYTVLQHLWEEAESVAKESDIRARLIGVGSQMTSFDFNFGVYLGAARSIYSEILTLVELILVMPATNATSERSFSALCRIKSYLRTTMSQQRLNNLMVIFIHRDSLDEMNLEDVADEFISAKDSRLKILLNEQI